MQEPRIMQDQTFQDAGHILSQEEIEGLLKDYLPHIYPAAERCSL